MPQVPKVQPGSVTPLSRVGDTGQVGRALAGAGAQFQQLGGQVTAFSQAREQAKLSLLTKELEFKYADTYRKQQTEEALSTDHNNFGKRTADFSESARNSFEEEIASLKPRQQEILRLQFNSQTASFQNHMKVREIQEVVKATQAVAGRMVNEAGVAFANAGSQEEALIIQERLFAELDVYVDQGMLNANAVGIIKRNFVDTAEDARFDQMVRVALGAANEGDIDSVKEALLDKVKEFGFDPKEQEAAIANINSKVKQRKNEAKVAKGQAKKDRKEAEEKAHDEHEKKIGTAFALGDYTKALKMTQESELLSGDEQKAWATSIRANLDTDQDTVSDTIVANEIIAINGKISRNEDPLEIQTYIAQSAILGKEDKEQYINKVGADVSKEIKDATGKAYAEIKETIIPKRGITAEILETSAETRAVRNAQDQLDEWIKGQEKLGKSPAGIDIRKKGKDLAQQNQLSFAEKLAAQQAEARALASDARAAAESRAKLKKEIESKFRALPRAERDTIRNTLKEEGFKTTKENIVKASEGDTKTLERK